MDGYAFTESLKKMLGDAREEAARLHHEYVGTEHLLLALTRAPSAIPNHVLLQLGVDKEQIRDAIGEIVRSGVGSPTARPDLPYTSRAKQVLALAMEESRRLRHEYVGCEHMLLGLVAEGKGIAAQVLVSQGVTLQEAREAVLRLIGQPPADPPQATAQRIFQGLRPVATGSASKQESLGYDAITDIGLLYDAVPAYANRADVGFYVDQVRRVGERAGVMELGCGTGRILIPMARAGHPVAGIDSSTAMLKRCEEKLAREPDDVRRRVELFESDVTSLLGFGDDAWEVAIAPFRVLQHLTTTDQQVRCLSRVRACLERNGRRFIFDVFNPNFAALSKDRSAEVEDTPQTELPDGRSFRRAIRVARVYWLDQLSDVELIYYVRSADKVERYVHAFQMRWYTASELEHLLARSGFAVEAMYGTFDMQPLAEGSPEIVVVAKPI